jgi:hypothetical protein
MKRNVLLFGVVLVLLASACAPQAAPTANPVDVQQTAQAAAFTMVAETQQAQPTETPLPPTATPTTAPPTNTPAPLPTLGTPGTQSAQGAQGTQVTPVTGAALPTSLPTFTARPAQSSSGAEGNQNVCNQPLTTWQGPTANFSIANQTRPPGTIVLSMYVETEFNQCGYLIITGDSFSGPVGQYSAGAFITGKQNMKAFGSFRITEGKWKIVVRNDSILAQGGCSPNC